MIILALKMKYLFLLLILPFASHSQGIAIDTIDKGGKERIIATNPEYLGSSNLAAIGSAHIQGRDTTFTLQIVVTVNKFTHTDHNSSIAFGLSNDDVLTLPVYNDNVEAKTGEPLPLLLLLDGEDINKLIASPTRLLRITTADRNIDWVLSDDRARAIPGMLSLIKERIRPGH